MSEVEHSANVEAQLKKHNKIAALAVIGLVVSTVILMWICFVTRRGDVTRNTPQIESVDKADIPEESVTELENKVTDIISISAILMFVVSLIVGFFELDMIQNLQKQPANKA